jgi:ribosomal protein S18 acetylase RimI-like enzyme
MSEDYKSVRSEELTSLEKDKIEPAAMALSRAFHDSSVYVYAYPDARERKKRTPHSFDSVLRYGLRYGKVYTTSDRLEGVAVWMRSELMKMTIRRMWWSHALRPAMRMGLGASVRMLRLNDYIERKHIDLAPFDHLYLMLLGVDPEYQGNGYGGRLVRGMLAEAGEAELPCYLETTSEENVAFYEHLGFKVIDEFIVPKTTVKIWVMLCQA